jgi:hypothetical protein
MSANYVLRLLRSVPPLPCSSLTSNLSHCLYRSTSHLARLTSHASHLTPHTSPDATHLTPDTSHKGVQDAVQDGGAGERAELRLGIGAQVDIECKT